MRNRRLSFAFLSFVGFPMFCFGAEQLLPRISRLCDAVDQTCAKAFCGEINPEIEEFFVGFAGELQGAVDKLSKEYDAAKKEREDLTGRISQLSRYIRSFESFPSLKNLYEREAGIFQKDPDKIKEELLLLENQLGELDAKTGNLQFSPEGLKRFHGLLDQFKNKFSVYSALVSVKNDSRVLLLGKAGEFALEDFELDVNQFIDLIPGVVPLFDQGFVIVSQGSARTERFKIKKIDKTISIEIPPEEEVEGPLIVEWLLDRRGTIHGQKATVFEMDRDAVGTEKTLRHLIKTFVGKHEYNLAVAYEGSQQAP